jgi:hypothetical protein
MRKSTGGIERQRGMQLGRRAALLTTVLAVLLLNAGGPSLAWSSGTNITPDSLLPGNVVVSLRVVKRFFPEITHQASTGANDSAVGNPNATRKVIYENDDGSKKVTISVDQYRSRDDASSAYDLALEKSKVVPGFKLIRIPLIGQRSFAGSVTMGGETHIGIGVLDGRLILGLTLAGFNATRKNVSHLVVLARIEDAVARAVLGLNGFFD